MGEEIAFENGRISDFQGLVTLTLTLDRVILHTSVMHHSSTSTYTPNFIEIKETFYGRADGHLRPTLLGRQVRPSSGSGDGRISTHADRARGPCARPRRPRHGCSAQAKQLIRPILGF